MTTAAVQETAGAPDSAPATTVTGVLFPDWPAWAGDESEETTLELFEVAPSDAVLADVERPRLLTLADRLLKHLATDESEISDITAAAKAEVALITGRYEALAQKASKRAAWKRFALEQLAALLFPDARAKQKSLHLPYGTLARRDYNETVTLVDEKAALQRCFADNRRDMIKLTIATTAEEIEDIIVSIVRRCEPGGVHDNAGLTLTQAIRGEIDALIEKSDRNEPGTPRVKLALAWAELKKEPAVKLFAMEKGGQPGGVELVPASTKFVAEVTAS